ncbi:MAG: ZIP family metal transporter [Crocinitomicaceae bacterium]|jgi:ZIP family zinc transporter|nr:ZIP family metal transporter [Crocinitomicaceae bacterium]
MDSLIAFFERIDPVWAALIATTITWLSTALGASLVFFFKKINRALFDGLLGFTGGVMLAASFWSLLLPAFSMSAGTGFIKVMPVAIGFICGALFLFILDQLLPHLHVNFKDTEKEGIKTPWQKSTLLFLAITLHNIPEGLAVGVMFGGFALGIPDATIGGAVALTIGITIQNFPEGLAVAMPMRRLGYSRMKSFLFGQFSAAVEPIFGVIGVLMVAAITPILPYALSFAAGAMIYVVVEEVIPESQRDNYTDLATMGLIIGFILMTALDAGLTG